MVVGLSHGFLKNNKQQKLYIMGNLILEVLFITLKHKIMICEMMIGLIQSLAILETLYIRISNFSLGTNVTLFALLSYSQVDGNAVQ